MIRKFRDISLIEAGGKTLTVACDSCSGVGMLPCDIVAADGYFTGYRTAFVALAETLALGAVPRLVTNTLSVSMGDYGSEILRGIRCAAAEAGLSDDTALTGSTEDNFTVPATSIGVTVIGELTSPLPSAINGEYGVYLAGVPKSGAEVLKSRGEILTFDAIKKIKSLSGTADIIPVGSKGIAYELGEMVSTLNAVFTPSSGIDADFTASAGPATCAIFAADNVPADFDTNIGIPLIKIGAVKPI